MKKRLLFLFSSLLFLLTPCTNFVSTDACGYTINNLSNVLDWTITAGNNPDIHLNENGETDGILLGGSGSDCVFDYEYVTDIGKNEIMVDFYVNLEDINYENKPEISFIFKHNETTFCDFKFAILEDSFNASVNFGDKNLEYNGMLYKEKGHIQFRIAKDNIMNRETGEYSDAWNMVIGIQKKTVTTKNDNYSIKLNKFDDGNFIDIDTYLDSLTSFNTVKCEIKAISSGTNKISINVSQIGTNNFYNCYVYSNDYISFSDVDYTNLKMSYVLPDDNINYTGIVIKRYLNGEFDTMYQYSNKYANNLTEKYLKQASDYSYEVYGLEQVSSSNRIACNKIMFRIEAKTVTTRAGNPIYLLYGLLGICFLIAVFILVYVFRFDISDLIKRIFKR